MAKKKEVVITCNATNVKAVIEGLERGMAALAKEEEKLLNTIKQRGYAENDEKKRLKELENAMDAMRTNVQKNREEQKKLAEVMKDLSGAKLKDLKKALQEGKAALNNMTERDPKRKQLVDDLKRIEAQINKNTGATNKLTGAQKGFSSAIASTAKNLATYMIGFAGFNKVKSLVEDVFRSNLKLSDSLANIRKVSGLSSEAINELYRNISKIDSRNTIETLNNLAYTGAKLGIGQNYGVAGLTGFVKAAEQVQMALGEDMGEKALPDLSKMVEVMGLIPKYGVEQSMQKAASAIFQLGATSTATGTNIVEFSKRLYGLANVSRISTQDLLALGSASDAMGLMPEVSATAFNKLFTSIQRQHNLIEQSLGMTKGRIKELYDEGKTMDAIVEIFERMNQKGNLNLLGNIFKDLGSDGARLVNVMATMADRADILRKHLQTSRDAFKEGEAVIGEYMIQNQTAAALVERASNLWAKAFVNPEGVDMVKEMAQAWYDLSKQMTQSDALMGSLHTSIELIAGAISTLIKLFPVLIRFGIIFATTFGFKGLIAGIGGLVTAFRTLYTDIALATGAMGKFNVMMKSNAILFAISSLITAVTLFNDYSKAAEEAAKREAERQAKMKAAFEESKEAVENVIKPLERYKRILEEGNLSEKQKAEVIKELNNKYQEYLDYLGIEIKSAKDLAKAYAKVVEIMQVKKAYEERESFRQQKNGDNRMSRIEGQAKVEAAARSFGVSDAGKAFLEHSQNTYDPKKGKWISYGQDDVYRQLVERKMGVKAFSQSNGDITFLEIDGKIVAPGTQHGPKAKVRYRKVGSDELYDAIGSYIESYRAERDVNKEVDAMFDSEYSWTDKNGKKRKLSEFDIDEYNDTVQKAVYKRKGSLENEKPDKAAIAAAKKADQEEKNALRKDLQDAKQDSDAVISKIEEWYRLQETVITDMQADGKLTKEQAEQVVRTLNIAKNTALRDARLAISGRDTKAWETTKQEIGTLMLDQGKWSQELLGQILGVSMESIRANLAKIDKGGGKYGITTSSLKDAVDKNAAGNQREIARLMARAQQEVEKIFMEYDFFEQAMRGFSNRLAQMGILTETARNMAERLADANNVNTIFSMKDYDALLKGNEGAKQQMLQAFIASGAQPYGVNPEDKEQLRAWFMEFVGEFAQKEGSVPGGLPAVEYQYQSWAKPFEADFDLWLRDSDKYLASIQSFYLSLMKSEEDYYEKRKQSYNHYKKQLEQQDQAAGIPTQREDTEKRLQTESQLQDEGIGASFWRQQGLGGIMNDPEVMLIQQRIEWRNQDLESAKALLAGKEALWQQEKAQRLAAGEDEASIEADLSQRRMGFEDLIKERQTALFDQQLAFTTKIAQEMRKRVQTVNSLTKPIQDGAENIGKKFGEMLRGVEEDSMTWNEIWRSMAQAVGDSIVDMMAQYAQNMIMEKMMNQQSKQEAISKAQVDVAAGTASAAAKTVGTLGWWGLALIPVIAAVLHGLLAAAFASNKQSDTSKSATAPKLKLVGGMLTYDGGTDLSPYAASSSQQKHRYIGTDGRVYTAREDAAPKTGLITKPIATTVQGQPALVAERGPEIVIGRKTTKRIQMAAPELLHAIQLIDRGYTPRRLYDEGTPLPLSAPGGFADGNTQQSDQDAQMQQTLAALTQTVAVLSATVTQLQQKGIPAHINKYGSGGLIEEVKSGLKFDARYNK